MDHLSAFAVEAAQTATLHGSGDRVPREFLDFVVDGTPLRRAVFPSVRDVDEANDYVSVLGTNWPVNRIAADVLILLGEVPSGLADGRVPLYVCAECGGLGCGAVSAVIERTDEVVTWRDFGWQSDYDPFVDREPFEGIGPIRFARRLHEETFRAVTHRRP